MKKKVIKKNCNILEVICFGLGLVMMCSGAFIEINKFIHVMITAALLVLFAGALAMWEDDL